jgi:tetratricopeptide (TPR) repeat protein
VFGQVKDALLNYEKVALLDNGYENILYRIEIVKKRPEDETRGNIMLGIIRQEDQQEIVLTSVHNRESDTYQNDSAYSPVSFSMVHNNNGVENSFRGRSGEAQKEFNLSLSLDKNLTAAYNNLALLALQEKDWGQAENYLNKALYLNPGLGVLMANRGLLHHLKGDLDRAARDYQNALSMDDTLLGVQINLGDILYKQEKAAEAIVFWQRAFELSPFPELAQRRLMWKTP